MQKCCLLFLRRMYYLEAAMLPKQGLDKPVLSKARYLVSWLWAHHRHTVVTLPQQDPESIQLPLQCKGTQCYLLSKSKCKVHSLDLHV